MGATGQPEDAGSHHRHGSIGGHVLPGAFFIIWSTWWFLNISSIYIHRTQRKKAFKAQAHFRFYLGPSVPAEAFLKISLCFVGILGELYFSHHATWRCGKALHCSGGEQLCCVRQSAHA
jgi:hypothetical protein